jgi:hypothetical protein
MATTHTRHPLQAGVTQMLVLAGALWLASATVTTAQETRRQAPTAPVRHVRPVDPAAATLLEHGARLSPTVARLLQVLEHSDLFVYVETGCLKVKAALRFAVATPQGRFLRITINAPELECRMIGELAHELQHAVEIAGAPQVKDTASLNRYYEIEGIRTPEGGYCTLEARRVGLLALYEVNSGASLRVAR